MLAPPQPVIDFEARASNDARFLKALGARIAELRTEQGLSQQALADELAQAER